MDSGDKKNLLLVEDEAIIAAAQKKTLETKGYSVITAKNGEQAVKVFAANDQIDLVLMDIDLGHGVDGTQVARQLLALRPVPVVFLSSHSEPDFVDKTDLIASYGYVVKSAGKTVLDASIRMAFRLFETTTALETEKENLRASEARLTLVNNSSGESIFSYDRDGRFTSVNRNLCELLKLDTDGFLGKTLEELSFPPEILRTCEELQREVYRNDRTAFSETGEIRVNKSLHFYEITLNPLHDGKGGIIGIGGTAKDITVQKRAEIKLKESEAQYKRITAGITDYLYTVYINDGKATDTVHNEACTAVTGYSPKDFRDDPYLWYNMVVPEDRDRVTANFSKLVAGADLPQIELRITCKDGSIKWISDTSIPHHDDNGTLVSYDGVIKDITERKNAEEKLGGLLREKELVLKEVHHRIKNNMNTIHSLLTLQAATVSDAAAFAALEDAGSRVRSMMMLYDKLYQSADFNEIPLAQYLPSLVDEIISNFPNRNIVKIEKNIGDFLLDVKKLQPLGIIVNELLTNIMKYAFTGKKEGRIAVSANCDGDLVSIVIEDDGNGMPESVDFENSTGFGLVLVGGLTHQLGGTIHIVRSKGTRIILEFKK